MNARLFNMHMDQLVKQHQESAHVADIIKDMASSSREFFKMGAKEVADDVLDNMISLMEANVNNTKLTDKAFREMVDSMIMTWKSTLKDVSYY